MLVLWSIAAMAKMEADVLSFLSGKLRALEARAGRLSAISPAGTGVRRQDRHYVPSPAHFRAVNARLKAINGEVRRRFKGLRPRLTQLSPQTALYEIALVEREVDRARRTFGMFFEVFSQRGTAFGPVLAAHDAIASDCYDAVTANAPDIFGGHILRPVTYLEHGYSPATMRRGVTLGRLLGDSIPFPLIRIPWDRDNPWQVVFLHEVAHNLQADLRLWHPNKTAVLQRLQRFFRESSAIATFGRWHKEIFADLAALLLGGPAAAWGLADFFAHPSPKVLTYRPGGAHPTGYLRVLILVEMLKRMGFAKDAKALRGVWTQLYDPSRGTRIPQRLLSSTPAMIPHVVDEIAFQPRRALAGRTLADLLRFSSAHERNIRAAAVMLMKGSVPADLAPRHLVSASRYALIQGAPVQPLNRAVVRRLSVLPAKAEPRAMPVTVAA